MVGDEKRCRADDVDPEFPTVHQTWLYSGTKKTYASMKSVFDDVVQSKQKENAFHWKHCSVFKNERSCEVKQLCAFARNCSVPLIRVTA
jgi:hypothetical protein